MAMALNNFASNQSRSLMDQQVEKFGSGSNIGISAAAAAGGGDDASERNQRASFLARRGMSKFASSAELGSRMMNANRMMPYNSRESQEEEQELQEQGEDPFSRRLSVIEKGLSTLIRFNSFANASSSDRSSLHYRKGLASRQQHGSDFNGTLVLTF